MYKQFSVLHFFTSCKVLYILFPPEVATLVNKRIGIKQRK